MKQSNRKKVKLADLCVSIDYGYTQSARQEPIGPKFLRITDIVNGYIDWKSVPYCEANPKIKEKYSLKHGDIVIARTGASTGISVYIKNPPTEVIFASYLIRFRFKKDVCSRFISYYLKSPYYWSYIKAVIGDKSAQPNASASTLGKAPVLLPPLPEQEAIAHILGTLDDKIELNRRMNETLEEMARAIFKSWFVDFDPVIDNALKAGNPIPDALAGKAARRRAILEKLEKEDPNLPKLSPEIARLFPDSFEDSPLGPIPKGWRVGKLGDLSEKPQYGYTASAKEEPVGPKFLRITDINKTPWIDWSTVPYCEISDEELEQYRLYPGDVLIARMADPGHGVLIEEKVEAVFASYLIRFRPKDLAYARYIQYWLRCDNYWELVTTRIAGTTRASLNAKVLSDFPILIPSKAVVLAFSKLVDALRNKVVGNIHESRTLATLRDTLLPKLISGQIRIKDAEKFVEEVL